MARKLEFEIAGKSNVDPAVNQARNSINKLRQDVEKAFDFKGALSSAFLSAFGVASILDKTIRSVAEGYTYLADIADKSTKAGIGADEFNKLAFAANDAGVSTTALSKAVRELRFFLKDAKTDASKMKLLTEGLGFNEQDIKDNKVTIIDFIYRIAQGMSDLKNDTDKLSYSTAFLSDKYANDFLPVFESINKDKDIFKGLEEVTDESAKKADMLDRAWHKLATNFKINVGTMAMALSDFLKLPEETPEFKAQMEKTFGKQGEGIIADTFGTFKQDKPLSDLKTNANLNAQAVIDAGKKSQDTSGTKNSTISGSFNPENGPTGGVIGVGNNAQNIMLSEQVDLLTEIRDILKNTTPQGSVDFTKQMLDRTRFTA